MVDYGNNNGYPIGLLIPKSGLHKTIKVHFLHYASFSEALYKWNLRKDRLMYFRNKQDKIRVINNCTNKEDVMCINDSVVANFNSIKYKKVIFVERKYGFNDEYVVKPLNEYHNGYILDRKRKTWKLLINNYNFRHFFK